VVKFAWEDTPVPVTRKDIEAAIILGTAQRDRRADPLELALAPLPEKVRLAVANSGPDRPPFFRYPISSVLADQFKAACREQLGLECEIEPPTEETESELVYVTVRGFDLE